MHVIMQNKRKFGIRHSKIRPKLGLGRVRCFVLPEAVANYSSLHLHIQTTNSNTKLTEYLHTVTCFDF